MKNGIIVKYMVLRLKGQNHRAAIVGPSVHNLRIETVWVDVYQVSLYVFHGLFKSMVAAGALDLSNAIQMYAFHFTFLPINPKKFRNQVSICILIGSSQPRYYAWTLWRGYCRSNYQYMEPPNERCIQIFKIPFINGNFWLSTCTYMTATAWL